MYLKMNRWFYQQKHTKIPRKEVFDQQNIVKEKSPFLSYKQEKWFRVKNIDILLYFFFI